MNALILAHVQVLRAAAVRLLSKPLSTGLTLLGIGVALALPLVLYVLVSNFTHVVDGWPASPRFSVFLERELQPQQARKLTEQLDSEPDIRVARLIPREQGLDELLGFGDLSVMREQLEENPLPDVIEVMPLSTIDSEKVRRMSQRIAGMPGVDLVQMDLEWVNRLQLVGKLAIRLVAVFGLLLVGGVGLVISNSVRLGIMTAHDEIEIVSLVGGTRSFVRRPFLYSGFLQGMFGALVALGLMALTVAWLGPVIGDFLHAWGVESSGILIPWGLFPVTLILAALVGWGAAYVTVSVQLKRLSGGF